MPPSIQLTLQARPKVNLWLHITGRYDDGYHRIHSLVCFPDTGDMLTFHPQPDNRPHAKATGTLLDSTGTFAPAIAAGNGGNLILDAVQLYEKDTKRTITPRITLEKNLPVAAGLGGGSSDAATTFIGMEKLYGPMHHPFRAALSLGADVPMCLHQDEGAFIVSNIGEEITPLPTPLPTFFIVFVNPMISLSAADVYDAYGKRGDEFSPPPPPPHAWDTLDTMAAYLRHTRNDLLPAAMDKAPVIADILERLANTTGCVFCRLSGSGPTCFGLYATLSAAHNAADALHRHGPHWWVQCAPMMC